MTRPTDDALAELARLDSLRRRHYVCDDCWYSCPRSEDGCCNDLSDDRCNCGADAHNARVDAVASTVAALVAEVRALREAVAEMVDYAEHSFERHEPGVTCRSCAVVEIGRRALGGAE